MICDAVGHGTIELAHRGWELRGEPVALSLVARFGDKWFHEDPIELEPARQPSVVASEGIGRDETFEGALIAIR